MSSIIDEFELDFDAEYALFGDEFEDVPGIYVIYTEKMCLEIGSAERLKTAIEENVHVREWVRLAEGKDILVALHFDDDEESKKDKEKHLRAKLKPEL